MAVRCSLRWRGWSERWRKGAREGEDSLPCSSLFEPGPGGRCVGLASESSCQAQAAGRVGGMCFCFFGKARGSRAECEGTFGRAGAAAAAATAVAFGSSSAAWGVSEDRLGFLGVKVERYRAGLIDNDCFGGERCSPPLLCSAEMERGRADWAGCRAGNEVRSEWGF